MQDKKKSKGKSSLSVSKGVPQPPSVNPELLGRIRRKRKEYSVSEYVDGILGGNITLLSQAITLVESNKAEHFDLAQEIVEACLPHGEDSIRIGITGVPGAGKSTFIETLGKKVTALNRKLAVLAIDPSSEKSHGSILGDKTRMESLAADPLAFIRPSPSAGSLGGVARKTRETIILCEAAGFNTIFVETVGVGQSETMVHSMVDFFLLLMISGAGDELQGIKRGIMEMADTIVINKADGSNIHRAEMTKREFQNALTLFPPSESGWKPRVLTCSAIEIRGIDDIWNTIEEQIELTKGNGFFIEKRKKQSLIRMHDSIIENLKSSFYNHPDISSMLPGLEAALYDGRITSYSAAGELLHKYFKKKEH
ncbi:MAG: methylmalonyl Co-A mutase-associated GTPase MeaB [Bacteroidales bacterium]|jgi:LAO/AO transport system kinase|nr:methylmalonyl Co-A mutase-associated GTPase MeaB [Bacteroidales bacterium]